MKVKICPLPYRIISAALAVIVPATSLPNNVWAAAFDNPTPVVNTMPGEAGPTRVISGQPVGPVTRLPVSAVTFNKVPNFSNEPTDREFSNVRAFEEGLVPISATHAPENKLLAVAITRYVQRSDPADQSALLNFLEQFPNSAWKPSLLINLGISWRQSGFFTKAMNAWQEAWELTRNEKSNPARALADRACAEFLQINAWVGRLQLIEPLLTEVSERQFSPGAAQMISGTREAIWFMKNQPEKSFSCGPYALREILLNLKATTNASKVIEAKPSGHGFNLTEVAGLAGDFGLKYQMARRQPGSVIPLNSVVHWKLDHYGAIIKEQDGKYLVQDSTFALKYGEKLWVSKTALEEESSGYFLIPTGPLPDGWTRVTGEEGKTVWGRGATCCRVPTATTPCDEKSCNNCNATGMPQYSVHLMLCSLNIVDIPVGYTPPKGPAVNFRVTYNQYEQDPTKTLNYGNLGPNWSHDYFSFIQDLGLNGNRDSVTRHSAGGGFVTHGGYDSVTKLYTIDRFGAVLQYIPAPVGTTTDSYELLYSDGSKLVFAQQDTGGGSRKMFLTKQVDATGNAVTISYDVYGRITHINDALGQSTVLNYFDASDTRKITSVVDPFGRTAYFQYDQNGMLKKITDVGGMSSSFGYGSTPTSFINTMTTPYGPTTFVATESGYTRTLLVTDPNGDREYFVSDHEAHGMTEPTTEPTPASDPNGQYFFTTSGLYIRNTFYFGKKAMSTYSGGYPNAADYSSATTYHWLHGGPSQTYTSPILESVKKPLESRVYYWYPGQVYVAQEYGITFAQPGAVIQVAEDSATPPVAVTKVQRFAYNAVGNITSQTDPLGRVTVADYYSNGRDLQKIRRLVSNGTVSEVISELGSYANPAHKPASYTDAARQTYNLGWNNNGQLTAVTNPLSQVTRLVYDAGGNGYLQSVQQDWSGGTKSTAVTYDFYGRMRTLTRSDGYALTYDYDLFDRVTQVTYPDNSFEKNQYDRLDLVIAWDRAGKRTKTTYDNTGRPLTVKDHLNRVTSFGWCGCGGLDSLTDPMGRVTSWTRDLAGRVTDKIYQDTKTTHYTYEPLSGRLRSMTDPKTQVKTYSYNLDDSLKGVTYTGGYPTTPNVSFSYDLERRRMTNMVDGTGTTRFGYHPITTSGTLGAGRLAMIDSPFATITTNTITYAYDALGRVLSQTINGVSESMAYDALGRMTNHNTLLGNFIPAYVGDTTRLASYRYPNTQTNTFAYFGASGDFRLKQIWNKKTATVTISKFDYDYDVLGRIRHWTQQADAATPQVFTMDYDSEDQLLNALLGPSGGNPAKAFAFAYDGMGNRQSEQRDVFTPSQSSTVTTGTYNNVNQLTAQNPAGPLPVQFKGKVNEAATVTVAVSGQSAQSAQVLPDPDSTTGGKMFKTAMALPSGNSVMTVVAKDFGANGGNITTKNYSVTVAGSAARTLTYDANGNCTAKGSVGYEWDVEDRLVAINNGTLRSEFTYDGFGRRVMIVERSNGTMTSAKRFIWSGQRLCEERDLANTLKKRFYSEGQINYLPTAQNLFYTRDHLGSIREVTDTAKTVQARYDYDPYGRVTKVSGTLASDFLYTGHYYHAPSGLHLALYRAYDADLGRWLNRDPIGERGGVNLYGYTANNPANIVDPDGRNPLIIEEAVILAEEVAATVEAEAPAIEADIKASSEMLAAEGEAAWARFEKSAADLVQKARELYPKLCNKFQWHHNTPKYLGGDPNGLLTLLEAPYHQLITNAFRDQWAYGQAIPSSATVVNIVNTVYFQLPLPK